MATRPVKPSAPRVAKPRANPLLVIVLTIVLTLGLQFALGLMGWNYLRRRPDPHTLPLVGRFFPPPAVPAVDPLAAREAALAAAEQALITDQAALEQAQLALAAREADLAEQTAALAEREEALTAAETGQADAAAKLEHLVRLTAGMPAEDAVEIMANLDDGLAVAVLSRLSGKDGAEIMAAMEPVQAARLMGKLGR